MLAPPSLEGLTLAKAGLLRYSLLHLTAGLFKGSLDSPIACLGRGQMPQISTVELKPGCFQCWEEFIKAPSKEPAGCSWRVVYAWLAHFSKSRPRFKNVIGPSGQLCCLLDIRGSQPEQGRGMRGKAHCWCMVCCRRNIALFTESLPYSGTVIFFSAQWLPISGCSSFNL